jgi:hypothetical protein
VSIEKQVEEAVNDVKEFFANLQACPEKSFTLTFRGAKGKYNGADLLINKPAGKGLNFTE